MGLLVTWATVTIKSSQKNKKNRGRRMRDDISSSDSEVKGNASIATRRIRHEYGGDNDDDIFHYKAPPTKDLKRFCD